MDSKEEAIMRLFKSYIVEAPQKKQIPDEEALKKGIWIDKNCSLKKMAIQLFGKDGFLLNQTFHKSFQTVLKIKEEQHFLQQIVHYFTTYELSKEEYPHNYIYIPKETLEIEELKGDIKFVKINPITKEELTTKLWNLCQSKIALSKDTLHNILILKDYLKVNNQNILEINNKELKVFFYDTWNIIPEKPEEFFRYMMFKLTNETLIIKNKEMLAKINKSNKNLALLLLNQYKEQFGLKVLAQIFNRYKPLFLELKTTPKEFNLNFSKDTFPSLELKKMINKLSHLSKKYHKPFLKNDLDNFANWCEKQEKEENFEKVLREKILSAGIYRAIKLVNYLNYKKQHTQKRVYKIRNGKTWIVQEYKDRLYDPKKATEILNSIILEKLRENVLGKKIYLDTFMDLVLPQSEKQFIGNVPFGTSIQLSKESIILGIHWFDVDKKRVDLDLKIISDEYTIGWNEEYKKGEKILFSGDVTAAPFPNGACEYMYVDEKLNPTMISLKVNNFTREVDSVTYDFIFAKGYKEKFKKNYIVDPNDILVKFKGNQIEKGKAEHSLGVLLVESKHIKFIFTDLCTSNRIVSNNTTLEKTLREYLKEESMIKCQLKDYLQKAGAILVDKKEEADFDLSMENINKDTLLQFFL